MKSTVLLSRIERLLDTGGAAGDGAMLAGEYAIKVEDVNRRLEQACIAMDSGQIGEATAILEESPPLVQEAGMLNFARIEAWRHLCASRGWKDPPKIDGRGLDRVLMHIEGGGAVDPLLRIYRKAVLLNDRRLALSALQRLCKADRAHDWRQSLAQTENAFAADLAADLQEAVAASDADAIESIICEFKKTCWSASGKSSGYGKLKYLVEAQERKKREENGRENVSILSGLMKEGWNLGTAQSLLSALDSLMEEGFLPTDEETAIINAARLRSADELALAEFAKRRDAAIEKLKSAIAGDDAPSVRELLAAPEFIGDEPDAEILDGAHLVLRHAAAQRRRKTALLASLALIVLGAFLVLSVVHFKKRLFDEECEQSAALLAAMEKEPFAVQKLEKALSKLKNESPLVYRDNRVKSFEARLDALVSQNNARTNELRAVLERLKSERDSGWPGGIEAGGEMLNKAGELLKDEDAAFREDYLLLKAEWLGHKERDESEKRKRAMDYCNAAIALIDGVADKIEDSPDNSLPEDEIAKAGAMAEKWEKDYGLLRPDLSPLLDEAMGRLKRAANSKRDYAIALQKLSRARSSKDFLLAREELVSSFGSKMKHLKPYFFKPDETHAFENSASPGQIAFSEFVSSGTGKGKFRDFANESVLPLVEDESAYSLYGIWIPGSKNYYAISAGKPDVSQPSYNLPWQIEGDIYNYSSKSMCAIVYSAYSSKDGKKIRPEAMLLPTSSEIRNVADLARISTMDSGRFGREILELAKGHVKAASDNSPKERSGYRDGNFPISCFPAFRRVQHLELYFGFLESLDLMPKSGPVLNWRGKIAELAQPVFVDGIASSLSWICFPEQRVRERNEKCLDLLCEMERNGFSREIDNAMKAVKSMASLAAIRPEYAGYASLDVMETPETSKIRSVLFDKTKDGLLYVLRVESGRPVLKCAMRPGKNAEKWILEPGMAKEILAGEPLFRMKNGAKTLDFLEAVREKTKGLDPNAAAPYIEKIPFLPLKDL